MSDTFIVGAQDMADAHERLRQAEPIIPAYVNIVSLEKHCDLMDSLDPKDRPKAK